MDVVVEEIGKTERETLRHLLELYRYDFTEFDGAEIGDDGLYGYRWLDAYWSEAGRHAYLIRAGGFLAGFALVRELAPEPTELAEFFVLRRHRGGGVGRAAAHEVLRRFPGPWRVTQIPENVGAIAFWRRVLPAGHSDRTLPDGVQEQRFVMPPTASDAG